MPESLAIPGHSTPTPQEPGSIPPWISLLEPYYRRLGLALPSATKLAPEALPASARRLLAHSDDMTSTLEAFYGRPPQLRILSRDYWFDVYQREVVLELEDPQQPVEYGAISVHLQHLPPAARRLVIEGEEPFGRILEMEALAYLSWPQAFFAVRSDPHLSRQLGSPWGEVLYGRRNVLVDGRRRLLADVVEILASVPESPIS